MLAGQPPFVAATADALLRMHLTTAEPRPVTESRPTIPVRPRARRRRGLAKMPDDRFATTAQFAEAIAAAMTCSSADRRPRAGRPRTTCRGPHPVHRPRAGDGRGVRLLGDTRLLTLTGIGGGGKTRLALAVAEGLVRRLPRRRLVRRPGAGQPTRTVVPQAVARRPGVRESRAQPTGRRRSLAPAAPAAAGARQLRAPGRRRAALADDAAARLPAACASSPPAARRWASTASGWRCHRWPLPPPDARDARRVAALRGRAAVRRAGAAAARRLRLTDENAPAVAEICRRLDGIPLAIELAAARVRRAVGRADRRAAGRPLPAADRRQPTALPRQQTLQATIDWSYDLLSGTSSAAPRAWRSSPAAGRSRPPRRSVRRRRRRVRDARPAVARWWTSRW